MTVMVLGFMLDWTDVSVSYFNRTGRKRQIKKL